MVARTKVGWRLKCRPNPAGTGQQWLKMLIGLYEVNNMAFSHYIATPKCQKVSNASLGFVFSFVAPSTLTVGFFFL